MAGGGSIEQFTEEGDERREWERGSLGRVVVVLKWSKMVA